MASPRTFECPVCGGDVPAKAKACPSCGACEKSGWGDTEGDGLDLPGEDFDYDNFKEEEFGTPRKLKGKQRFWKIAGAVIFILALIGYVLSFTFR